MKLKSFMAMSLLLTSGVLFASHHDEKRRLKKSCEYIFIGSCVTLGGVALGAMTEYQSLGVGIISSGSLLVGYGLGVLSGYKTIINIDSSGNFSAKSTKSSESFGNVEVGLSFHPSDHDLR